MPASQSPSTSTSTFQRQLECDPSVENLTQEESLPQYVENEKSLESCTQSPRSSQSTGSKIKSAVWSFVKGDVYKHHPARVQEKYFNSIMEAQKSVDQTQSPRSSS
ncbi:hypothetical protein POX_g08849 [Penicillium oxalicum]|uniref:Uncharacterized protein n=1 Tax=Penicillium oxalicum (strain 114-2 / CGMCC 5302) TaxID=933388 RepID=S7ZDW2_PENO1|nr:hypothetical protein POX_g08849 [Penicillium oxalicum]EPS26851.1 hypothetical protein PDE_01791 [Penicillium oxalicum 114-2]KAI2786463.1 hypothetical protein POX_g08849 [Penicillium oxalicum]